MTYVFISLAPPNIYNNVRICPLGFKGLIVNCLEVALPALLISLRLYLKFFRMIEAECFELDLNIFAESAEGNHTSDSINNQILLFRQLKKLDDEKEKLKNEIDFINSTTIAQVLHNPENEIQIKSMY